MKIFLLRNIHSYNNTFFMFLLLKTLIKIFEKVVFARIDIFELNLLTIRNLYIFLRTKI